MDSTLQIDFLTLKKVIFVCCSSLLIDSSFFTHTIITKKIITFYLDGQ